MKKSFKYIFIPIFLLVSYTGFSQQDPQFTQYMYNMSVINPAYATDSEGIMNVGGLYRTQWVGAVGAPKTASLFLHSPVAKRVEMGVSVVNDQIGDVVNENNLYVDFAYVLPVSETAKISFGLKAGATFFDADFNGFQFTDATPDPAFFDNVHKVFPNVGVGTFFFGENYYLGLSAPNLLRTKHIERSNSIATIGVEEIHYFFTGGYVFNLSNNLRFKPAFMAKQVDGAPLSVDLTANFLINNLFEVGAGYRLDDSVSGLVNFYITPSLRAGYAYDYTVSNLGNYNSGTHEIFILFDVNVSNLLSKKGYDKSPRFF